MGSTLHRKLQQDLDHIRRFVREGDWISLDAKERQGLEQAAAGFQLRLDAARDELLCAGFLGGTGVGKSSLMNALARAEVAGTSHRRPYTDHILIYHHAQVELPSFVHQSQAVWAEHVHQAEAVQDILLCDLPDFDSLRPENKEAVLGFMSHLDLLVWVASPEKYADRSLHDALGQAPKAAGNFYFVLNKMDRLWDRKRAEQSLDQMQRVAEHFRSLLTQTLAQRADIQSSASPRLFAVSALEEQPHSAWNQLSQFREVLFARRSAKQVEAIKAANLEQEMSALYQPLIKEKEHLEQSLAVVRQLQGEVEAEGRSWSRDGETILASWVKKRIKPLLIQQGPGLAPLFGPARLVGMAVREFKQRGAKELASVLEVGEEPGLLGLHSRMKHMKNRLLTQVLRSDNPRFLSHALEEAADVIRLWDQMASQWQGAVNNALAQDRPAKWPGLAAGQILVYALLILFLLIGLGGGQAWKRLISHPGPGSVMEVFFSAVETLFSLQGVAALVSFGLLMLGAGVRFYQAWRRKLQDWAQDQGRILNAELTSVWTAGLDEVKQNLENVHSRLRQKLQSLDAVLASGE
ncbi:MAG: GTPase [Desulfovermiculus sp.]